MPLFQKKIARRQSNPLEELASEVKSAILNLFPTTKNITGNITLNLPPPHIKADYSFPVFILAEFLKKDPIILANDIAAYLDQSTISRVKKIFTVGPYINLELDKSLFYRDSIKYICELGDNFGVSYYKNKNRDVYHFNYIYFNTDIKDFNNFRINLVGHSIGRLYELSGNKVTHSDFNLEKDKVISMGQRVIKDVLKYNLADYILDTNAIITSSSSGDPQFILQKHNKLITNYVLYLALIKKQLSQEKEDSTLIFICSKSQMNLIESLIRNARQMGYVNRETNIKTSFIVIEESDYSKPFSREDLAFRYELLRIPINKTVLLNNENLSSYLLIKDLIKKNFNNDGDSDELEKIFPLIQLLLHFPIVLEEVEESREISNLSGYLDKILNLFQGDTIKCGNDLSRAISIVLSNGLKILTS